MDFGESIKALKDGKKVARKGWNGNGMFLYYVPANRYTAIVDAAINMAGEDGKVSYGAYIAMKTAQGNIVPWQPSQTDMLSDDWELCNSFDEISFSHVYDKGYFEVRYTKDGIPNQHIFDINNLNIENWETAEVLPGDAFTRLFTAGRMAMIPTICLYDGHGLINTSITLEDLEKMKRGEKM